MNKKFLTILLIIAIFVLNGCANKQEEVKDSPESTTSNQTNIEEDRPTLTKPDQEPIGVETPEVNIDDTYTGITNIPGYLGEVREQSLFSDTEEMRLLEPYTSGNIQKPLIETVYMVKEENNIRKDTELFLPIPDNIRSRVTIKTMSQIALDDISSESYSSSDFNSHYRALISISESRSVVEGQADHPGQDHGDGWICSISELDEAGYEKFIGNSEYNYRIFAKSEDNHYYMIERPSDVRIFRLDEISDDDIKEWTELNEWALDLPTRLISENNILEKFDEPDFKSGFIYEGEHQFVKYINPYDFNSSVILTLSQPLGTGVWCVEKQTVINQDGTEEVYVVNTTKMGIALTSSEYYNALQELCKKPEYASYGLNTPDYAVNRFIYSDAWIMGDKDLNNFCYFEYLG